SAIVPHELVKAAITEAECVLGRALTSGQAKAVRGICGEGRRISLVLGVAGAGTTTAIRCAAEAYIAAGYEVVGSATSGQAARRHGSVRGRTEDARQGNRDEREALRQLRGGNVADAVAWYAANYRIRMSPDVDEALRSMVDVWYADVCAGRDAAMYAWRRTKRGRPQPNRPRPLRPRRPSHRPGGRRARRPPLQRRRPHRHPGSRRRRPGGHI